MKNLHLLLVDDEKRFLSTTRQLLENRGVTTHTAERGREALRVINDTVIDVVLLDVKMPEMDGIATLRKIKQGHPLVEVIMLTGHASVDSAVDGMRLGAFDYLVKPCEIDEMLNKVKQAFMKKQATEEKIQKVNVERIISHPLAVFDKDKDDQSGD